MILDIQSWDAINEHTYLEGRGGMCARIQSHQWTSVLRGHGEKLVCLFPSRMAALLPRRQ
jgi:hypothetical protein